MQKIAPLLISLSVFMCNCVVAGTDTVHLANTGEPQTLDPHRYNLRLEETILTDLFLGLTTFNAAGEIVPGAAESWRISDDGLTWTFRLRPDMRWSDGVPVTAQDFAFSFQRLMDPQTAASLAYFLYPLKNAEAVNGGSLPLEALGVSAPDPHTLVLELAQPYPHLAERLLYPTGYPVPRHVIAEVGDDWVKSANWVSNGAYTLTEWRPQGHVLLTSNPYFIEPAEIENVYYHPLSNEQTAYNRYRSGEMDAISTFPAGELPRVKTELADQLRQSQLLSIVYLVFNTRQAPFDDPRVREALSIVIDTQILTQKVQRAGNLASPSFVPMLVVDYESVAVPHWSLSKPQRQARARELLQTAGFNEDNPLKITLRYASGAQAKRSNLAIASFWKQIGVETRLHHTELKVHFSDLRQGNFEVAQAGWFGENNAEHYLGLLMSDTGNVNYGGYSDETFDSLMAAALAEASIEARNRRLRQAEAYVIARYPVVPLWSVGIRRLVNVQLNGWHENPRDVHPARYLSW